MLAPNRLPELLQRPLRGRMRRHVEVKHLAGADFHDDEDLKHAKADGDYVKKIRSDDRFCVIPHECRPAMRRIAPVRAAIISNGYVLPNGARRDADAKLDEQLVGDPSCPRFDPRKKSSIVTTTTSRRSSTTGRRFSSRGRVRAGRGDLGIIPGSMGARSYIVRGKGNRESFESCSHGAGRVMSRNEAKKRFTLDDHAAATAGVECRKDVRVLDETPGAYKDIDAVMEAQSDLVRDRPPAQADRLREGLVPPTASRPSRRFGTTSSPYRTALPVTESISRKDDRLHST